MDNARCVFSFFIQNQNQLFPPKYTSMTSTYETWIQINSEDRTNPVKEKAKSTAFVTLSGSTSSLVRGDILISNGTSSLV